MRPRWGDIRSVHLMGIGGAGMCALAEILLDDGIEISGCDTARSDRTKRLEARGVTICTQHGPDHVSSADALVISAAVPSDHAEITAAANRGISIVRRSTMLAEVLRRCTTVAVAGTHGKTTTSALLAHILMATGADPTVAVGGLVRGLDIYGRRGSANCAVCEADEYDRAFLTLTPTLAIVTNVEADHLEYYGSSAALTDAFSAFLGRLPFHGKALVCGDDPGAAALADSFAGTTMRYGLKPTNDLKATSIQCQPTATSFTVVAGDRTLGRVETPLAGEHNIRNTLAALGAGLELGIDFVELARACGTFHGVGRRFERLGVREDVTVIDDYAHHPTEIEAVLSAVRQSFPGRRIVAVFQPHLYSRTRDLAAQFALALSAAEQVVLLPIFAARERPIDGVSHLTIADAMPADRTRQTRTDLTLSSAPGALDLLLHPGDILLSIGAGDVDSVAHAWLGGGA